MTRRLLTISFSLFLVSAMMGTFPIPGTNSVSIPSGTHLDSLPSSLSSSAISVATDAGAIAGTEITTPSSLADSVTLQPTNATGSINAVPPGTGSPELIKVLKSDALTSDVPPTTASSGFSRTSASPLTAKQPAHAPQKRVVAAATAADSSQQKWTPSQGQQGQQGQQSQQGQHGQQWYPSQGQQGQQWYPSQGQQGQWYQQGQQWYQQQAQGRQPDKPYTIHKRAASTLAAATAPQGGSPTYRMSALVCNLDTATRGLIHCSDNKDYYTLEQPPNPANSADPRNRPWSAGTGTTPAGQGNAATGPAAGILRKRAVTPQGVGYQRTSIGSPAAPPGGVSTLEADPQGWFRRPQPYGAQPQPQNQAQSQPQFQQAQVYKRQAAGAAVAAASDSTNQAGAASLTNQANAAAAAAILNQATAASAARQRGHPDLGNLSKWFDSRYNGVNGDGGNWHGKGGSTGYGKDWKRSDHDEGILSKWSQAGAASGYGSGGRDEWSHYGKGEKKWNKREGFDEGNLSKWSGSGSGYGRDGGDDWSRYGKGGNSDYGKGGKGDKKLWNKRQVPGPAGAYGRPNPGAIPVPIDVGLVWDGNSVNLVPPPSSRSGSGGPGGPEGSVPGVGGIPAGAIVVGANSPAIPVPINVNALVYPDGQMQIFPSATPN